MFKIIEEKLEKDLKTMFESEQFQVKMDELTQVENNKDYKFKVVVTTEGVDRDGEVIKADGIDFKNYMNNPVVLIDHSYKVESIVGKTLKIYQENGKTIAEGVFAKGLEHAELIRSLYNQGFIKTVSIGFIPTERNNNDSTVIEKSEMLEFSFVAVPANPEALSLDGKQYQKAIDLGIIKAEKGITTEIIKAEDLQAGDYVTYRYVESYTIDGVEKEEFYPNLKKLPKMGKIIQIINDGSEVITWGESALIGNKENPILTIQSHIASENGPKTITMNVIMTKYSDVKIERIVSVDEVKKGFKDFSNQSDVDFGEVSNIVKLLREDVSEMKNQLKTFADDKVEEQVLEKSRLVGQDLAKSLSAYLEVAKKSKKSA